MTDPSESPSLSSLLRGLRQRAGLTQHALAQKLRPENPPTNSLISSWEREASGAIPSEAWLSAYVGVLSTPEARDDLLRQLLAARARQEQGGVDSSPEDQEDRFWRFGDGRQIRIIGSTMSAQSLADVPFADPAHPDYMPMLWHADARAVLDLYGHLKAENPESDVRVRHSAEVREPDLTGHVVVLGGGDGNAWAEWFADRMNIPIGVGEVAETPDDVSPKRHFALGEQRFMAEFDDETPDQKWPSLKYDAALIARQPNPLRLETTATLCMGLYGKGTLGAARTFTNPRLARTNEAYRRERFGDADSYYMLVRILTRGEIVWAPDLTREYSRLLEWSVNDEGSGD